MATINRALLAIALMALIATAAHSDGIGWRNVVGGDVAGGIGGPTTSSAPLGGALVLEDGSSFLLLEDNSSHLCFEGGSC